MYTSTLGLSAAAALSLSLTFSAAIAAPPGPRPFIPPRATAAHLPQQAGALGHPARPAPRLGAVAHNGANFGGHDRGAWRRARGYLPYGDNFVGYGADQVYADESAAPDDQPASVPDDRGGPRVYPAPPQAAYLWPQPRVVPNPGPKIIYVGKQEPRRHGRLPVVVYGIPPSYQVD